MTYVDRYLGYADWTANLFLAHTRFVFVKQRVKKEKPGIESVFIKYEKLSVFQKFCCATGWIKHLFVCMCMCVCVCVCVRARERVLCSSEY